MGQAKRNALRPKYHTMTYILDTNAIVQYTSVNRRSFGCTAQCLVTSLPPSLLAGWR